MSRREQLALFAEQNWDLTLPHSTSLSLYTCVHVYLSCKVLTKTATCSLLVTLI